MNSIASCVTPQSLINKKSAIWWRRSLNLLHFIATKIRSHSKMNGEIFIVIRAILKYNSPMLDVWSLCMCELFHAKLYDVQICLSLYVDSTCQLSGCVHFERTKCFKKKNMDFNIPAPSIYIISKTIKH